MRFYQPAFINFNVHLLHPLACANEGNPQHLIAEG